MTWIAWLLGALGGVMFMSGMVGYLAQPWASFWVAGHNTPDVVIAGDVPAAAGSDPLNLLPVPLQGIVSDAQRYRLARAAGWSPPDAITAVALSIAEDGSGNPAALSGLNYNGSRDLGLWQINSGWWPRFGGQAALIDPFNNAVAGHTIYALQGWCAWSTYEASCGSGHNSSYRLYLGRAQEAARVVSSDRES